MGFFKKIAARFTGEARAQRKADKRAFRLQKRKQKFDSLSDRERIAQSGQSDRAALSVAGGYDPATGYADEKQMSGFGGLGSKLLDKGKDFFANFMGGGSSQGSDVSGSQETGKDKTTMYVLLAAVGAFVLFMFNKKK